MIVTQQHNGRQTLDMSVIPKVPWSEVSKPINYEVEVHRYDGPKEPIMAKKDAENSVLPLRVLAKQVT